MKKNFKKILPPILSILVFSSAFIFLILRNSDNSGENLQLSPKNYSYKEKFGGTKSYNDEDISSIGLITNVRINQVTGVSEPKVVCSPLNENNLTVSANDFLQTESVARIFISEDAGINWQPVEIPLSAQFKRSLYSDSYMDYDWEGNLFFVSVQFDLNNNYKEGIFFARSLDNGKTWKTDFNFVDYNGKENIQLDRPKIYVDKSSVNKNTIFVTWIEVKGLNSFIMFSKSNDGGNSFSSPMKLEKNDVQYCSLVSNSKGNLFLTYLKEDTKITIKKSFDAGKSWSNEIPLIKIKPAGVKSESQYLIKNSGEKGIRINSGPSVMISKNDDLLLTYSARGDGNDLSDVYFAKLQNNTNEITNPIRVNKDTTSCDQFLPSIAADEHNNIVIMYQDSRNDVNNIQTEVYASVSTDGGLKFYDEKISTKDFNALQVTVEKYIGDYNSCLFTSDKFVGVWTDGRNNNLDVYAGIFSMNKFIENMTH